MCTTLVVTCVHSPENYPGQFRSRVIKLLGVGTKQPLAKIQPYLNCNVHARIHIAVLLAYDESNVVRYVHCIFLRPADPGLNVRLGSFFCD